MMRKKALLIIVAALAALGVLGCATGGTLTPLPGDVQIVAPDPSIGQVANFSGIWEGEYDTAQPLLMTLAVEKIDHDRVTAYYSVWSHQLMGGGGERIYGKVVGRSIVLEWEDSRAKRTLTLNPIGDKLHAVYQRSDRKGLQNRAVLTKKLPDPTQRAAPLVPIVPKSFR